MSRTDALRDRLIAMGYTPEQAEELLNKSFEGQMLQLLDAFHELGQALWANRWQMLALWLFMVSIVLMFYGMTQQSVPTCLLSLVCGITAMIITTSE